jgi:GNAT superfamily N-acetyltransferase
MRRANFVARSFSVRRGKNYNAAQACSPRVLQSPAVSTASVFRPPAAVSIAAASAGDLALVRRLADSIWHRVYPGIIPIEQIDYMLARGYSDEALARFVAADDAGLALAQRDGNAVGFVAWYRVDRSTTKLDKLYVLPEHHGAGVGRLLIEHVVAWARAAGTRTVELNVNRANVRAVAAYERCGFAIRERGDFPIGCGFVMEDYILARDVEAP